MIEIFDIREAGRAPHCLLGGATGNFVLRGFVSGEASGDDKLPRDWTNGDVGSSRHVKSVDVGHRGGERRVRGQGGVRSTLPATWVECLVWGAGQHRADISVILQETTAV